MSDFLSNLASTALRLTPIALPRTPALFEPRVVDADTSLESVGSVATPTFTPHTQTRVERRETREQLNTSMRSQSNHAVDSILRVEEKTPRSAVQSSTIATPDVTSSISRPAPIPLQRIEPSGREEQSGRAEAARSMVEEIASQVSTSPLTPRTSSVEIIHPRIERQARDVDADRDTIEPRVHISIGRIEVRAATSSAPARTAKREASILGLDDYLRQHR